MKVYDLIVIGSGAGLNVASTAANRGKEVAVIDKDELGGTCLNRGCIPSKLLIHHSDVADTINNSEKFNIKASIEDIDFSKIVSEVNDSVSEDSKSILENIENSKRITLYRDRAEFTEEKTLKVGGEKISAPKVVIAAGSRPHIPDIEGIDTIDYITSKEALKLKEKPEHLIIIGGGYVSAELAHFFGSLGTKITIVERSNRLLKREDIDVSEKMTEIFQEKYDVKLNYQTVKFESTDDGKKKVIAVNDNDERIELEGDQVLIAAGRVPNTDILKVERTGVDTDSDGFVETDEYLETNIGGIWALGDIAGNYMFRHSANLESQYVFWNALMDEKQPVDYTAMPHAVFGNPEIAGVGRTEQELKEKDIDYDVGIAYYRNTAMGSALKEEDGFAKVLVSPDHERILGCHILGPHASILIHEVILAMKMGVHPHGVSHVIHIHPALSEVIDRAFANVHG